MRSFNSILLAFDGKVPTMFAGFAVNELQFGYAIFQLLRNNTLFLLLLFFLPSLFFKLCYLGRLKHVVLLSDKKQYSTGMDGLGSCLQYLPKVGLRNVKRQSKHWYSVHSGNRYYLCHQNSLMPLADLCRRRHTQQLLFADSVVNVTDKVKVAKLIDTSEAIDKLLTGVYELCDADSHTVYYFSDLLKVDSNWIPVLSSFPIYLHAIGAHNLSGALSCIIILLDVFKNFIWRIYDTSFTKLTVFAKLRIFGKRTCMYEFLGIFSDRWKYCDPHKRHAYILKPGTHICVGKVCRFERDNDFQVVAATAKNAHDLGPNVEFKDGEVVQWSHRDEDFYFDIIDGTARFMQRGWGNFYLYVKTGCDIFVSDSVLQCK